MRPPLLSASGRRSPGTGEPPAGLRAETPASRLGKGMNTMTITLREMTRIRWIQIRNAFARILDRIHR